MAQFALRAFPEPPHVGGSGEPHLDMSEEHFHIGVRFFERDDQVQPPAADELRRAIRARLQQRYSPKAGEVSLSSGQRGWSPMPKKCWIHGVSGGSGPAYSKSVEGDVLAILARLGKLARDEREVTRLSLLTRPSPA